MLKNTLKLVEIFLVKILVDKYACPGNCWACDGVFWYSLRHLWFYWVVSRIGLLSYDLTVNCQSSKYDNHTSALVACIVVFK